MKTLKLIANDPRVRQVAADIAVRIVQELQRTLGQGGAALVRRAS